MMMATLFGVMATIAPAIAATNSLNVVGNASGLGRTNLLTMIGLIINILLGLVGVIFLLLIIYAGFLWMTSSGNEEIVAKAKNVIKSAIIGMIITLAAYAIATFIVNALISATGLGNPTVPPNGPPIELLSDALGSGGIEDHYPGRNATDIPRNTKIFVTFKNQINLTSFIVGYNVGADATITSDDTPPAIANVNTSNFTLSCTDQNSVVTTYTSADITVSFTSDLKTFSFDPPILGSAVAPVNCTVVLKTGILKATGGNILSENYEWSFQVSTIIDTTPPTVVSIVPANNATGYGRNITEQITFSEGVDPTTSTGTYDSALGGFTNILTSGDPDRTGTFTTVAGTYVTSSGYSIVEFTPTLACGTNSCGQTVYCLPGPNAAESAAHIEAPINLLLKAASVSADAPAANTPYTGLVDLAGNAFDGNGDLTAGDDKTSAFTITDNVVLTPPVIESVAPTVVGENVPLDQNIQIVWDSLMKSSTLTNATISIDANPNHDMWYQSRISSLDVNGGDPTVTALDPAKTKVTIGHGTFLQSSTDNPATIAIEPTVNHLYYPILPEGIESLYQNCFYPSSGPGPTDATTCSAASNNPNCCNGVPSASPFNETTFRCPSL